MAILPLTLPGPVALVAPDKVLQRLAQQHQRTGAGISIEAVVNELGRLAAAGALPARLDDRKSDWSLEVFANRHLVRLFPTQQDHAYMIGAVSSVSLRDQERLVDGALVLHCSTGWYLYQNIRDVPQTMRASWALVGRAWAQLQSNRPRPVVPPHHEVYLDLLTEVVEASRDIETTRQREQPPIWYRRKSSTREERYSARGVYAFSLVGRAQLAKGSVVYLSDDQAVRGRVLDVRDGEAVVRFEPGVDYRQIPEQGTLRSLPSDRVFRAQLDAIGVLRQGKAPTPGLLAALVDGFQQPYQPDQHAQPRNTLDEDQLAAFRRALTVPDHLLVLGPPGTGKTRTITEIAVEAAHRRQRVLITSYTNRAVDNVLEKLPGTVLAIRIGNEDTMTSHARGHMVEAKVDLLRDEILTATEAATSRLALYAGPESVPARFLTYLDDQLDRASRAEAERRRQDIAHQALFDRVAAPIRPQLAHAEATLAAANAGAVSAQRAAETVARRLAISEMRAAAGATFAFVHRWLAGRRRARWQLLDAAARSSGLAASQAEAAYQQLLAHANTLVAADPEAARINAAGRAAEATTADALSEVAATAEKLRSCGLGRYEEPPDAAHGVDAWAQYRQALARDLALSRCQAELLADWRAEVRGAESTLHHELVRYADVVAATCIGTATSSLLAGVEFDLAIVDEAGQISTPNLLVALVRARRSALVGDHRQLPPFLDNEVEEWATQYRLDNASQQQVEDLLKRSAFEKIYDRCDDLHRVMLKTQRRMPENLAYFVSRTFYDGQLRTRHTGGPPDPIFNRPFAMIDTSDRSLSERREQPVEGPTGAPSYRNELEARLIAALIAHHVRHYRDWAVITPFRPQVELVTQLLTRVLGKAAVTDNIGTVDSFQGGERDLIVYGFTRSNRDGKIGFLRELRRINVAITRAKQQLVVVGDRATLCGARDRGFADLATGMVDYLERNGAIHPSLHIEHQLAPRKGEVR